MIATRVMELRKRHGLMIALILLNIGFPATFLLIRLLLHAFAPHDNPPAGSDMIFGILVAGFLPTFGFIVAATVGCTAGSRDLTEGMFRHLVVTGRSRLALYLARIPAGLAIVVPLVAIGYTIVCAEAGIAAIEAKAHALTTGPSTSPMRTVSPPTRHAIRARARRPRRPPPSRRSASAQRVGSSARSSSTTATPTCCAWDCRR